MWDECVREETREACMSSKSDSFVYLFSCSYIFFFSSMNKASVSSKSHIAIWSVTRETGSLKESLKERLKFKSIMNTSFFSPSFSFIFLNIWKVCSGFYSRESPTLQPVARNWSLCPNPVPNTPSSPRPLPLGFIHLKSQTLDDGSSRNPWPQITQKALLQIWDSLLFCTFYRAPTASITFIPSFIPVTHSLVS